MGRFISRAFALFFVFLFIIVASISACTVAFRDSLINVDTYKQILVEQNVYEDVIPYVIPAILNNPESELSNADSFPVNLIDLNSAMTVDDWRAVSEQLVPPEWLQIQVESILDTINQISQGNFTQPETLINTTEFSERLLGDEAIRASEIIIASAPDCNAQQVIQVRTYNGDSDQTFPYCNPPAILQEKSVNIIRQWFVGLGTILNAQIRQQENVIRFPEEVSRLIYNLFQLDNQMSLLLFLCPLTLIGFIMVFAVRNLKSFGRWLGWTLIVTGIVTMILIFTSQVPVFESFDDVVSARTDIERFEAQIYAGFMRSIYADASNTMMMLAGGLIAGGFILLAISLLGRSHNLIVPEGAMLMTSDGRVISTSTQKAPKTAILDEDP